MDDFPFDSWFVVFFPSHLFLSFAHSLPFAVLSFTVTGGDQIVPFSLLLSVSHCFFLLDSKLTRPMFLCGLLPARGIFSFVAFLPDEVLQSESTDKTYQTVSWDDHGPLEDLREFYKVRSPPVSEHHSLDASSSCFLFIFLYVELAPHDSNGLRCRYERSNLP